MTFATFSPAVPPSPASKIDRTYRINKAVFGDGYEQRSQDGINSITRTITLQWDMLTTSEANAILATLDGFGGITPFYYTFPGETSAYLFVVDTSQSGGISKTATNENICSLRMTLRQVFDMD